MAMPVRQGSDGQWST
jgi:hypothetical protein